MKNLAKWRGIPPFIQKIVRAMKISVFLVLVCTMQLSASVMLGQQVSLQPGEMSVRLVFKELKTQTGAFFMYSEEEIERDLLVDIDFSNASLEVALEEICEQASLNYEIVDDYVLITKKAPVVEKPAVQQEKKTIKGRVTDKEGNTLPGVSVVVKGTMNGTATDIDGKYAIEVEGNVAVLVFSFVGMVSKKINYTGESIINAQLVADSEEMDEIVVTGYKDVRSNEFTGASISVKTEAVSIGGVPTIDKMLQGRVAGVSIETSSSVFGTAPKIRIRGNSSISGINEPLWVLDGIVLESPLNITPSELYSGNVENLLSSALGNINPEDIEGITVLKDATATALYGNRAVNGVIVITTKRAGKNQPLKVSYNTNMTMALKPSITDFNVLNSEDQVDFQMKFAEIYGKDFITHSAYEQGAYSRLYGLRLRKEIEEQEYLNQLQTIKSQNTDWYKELFRNSISQQHNIGISQGGERAKGRLSFGYYNDPGYSIGQNTNLITVNASSAYDISDKVSMDVILKYSKRDQRNPGAEVNPYIYAKNTSRAMKPYNSDGSYAYYFKKYVDFNIIEDINSNYVDLKSNDMLLQLKLSYAINSKIKLSVLGSTRTVNSSIDESMTEKSNKVRAYAHPNAFVFVSGFSERQNLLPTGGILIKNSAESTFQTLRTQLDWNAIKNENHTLKFFAGAEFTRNQQEKFKTTAYGYRFTSEIPSISQVAINTLFDENGSYYSFNKFNRNTLGIYSSLTYSLKNKYVAEITVRNDASNLMGKYVRNRFLPTWAVSGAWNISRETFIENLNIDHVISNVKLRASYGLRGNAGNRGTDFLAYYKQYNRGNDKYNELGIEVIEAENSSLSFEKEYMFSSGLDFRLFNKINIGLGYYNRNNFDLIGNRISRPSSGYISKQVNWATMQNRGYEISINTLPIKLAENFDWSGTFNLGYNRNKILSAYVKDDVAISRLIDNRGTPIEGKPVSGLYAFKFAELNKDGLPLYYNSKGEKTPHIPHSSTDYGNLEFQGSRDPIYSGGFSSLIRYKNLKLNTVFTFNLGHVVRLANLHRSNQPGSSAEYRDDLNVNKEFSNRWQAPGDEEYTSLPRIMDSNDYRYYQNNYGVTNIYETYNSSSVRTVDASYLRFKNIMLSYDFNKKLAEKMNLDYLSLSLQMTNIAVFASAKLYGQDPDILLQGLNIPPIKTVSFSIKLGF